MKKQINSINPDVDFNYGYGAKSETLIDATVTFAKCDIATPFDIKEYLIALKNRQARFIPDCNYANFNPVCAIIHSEVRGWTGNFRCVFYESIEDENFIRFSERAFPSEPTGKYQMKRKVVKRLPKL